MMIVDLMMVLALNMPAWINEAGTAEYYEYACDIPQEYWNREIKYITVTEKN